MATLSLQAKKAYFAKTRKSNYVASLRLEGFKVSQSDVERELPNRVTILNMIRSRQA